MSVDLPLPFSPMKNVTGLESDRERPARAGTENG